jgi:hypothetical protein
MTSKEHIEIKLANGVQIFSAQDVAHLVNQLRIQQELYKKLEDRYEKLLKHK